MIVSKDSIGRNLNCLDSWLAGEKEIFLIIDEAHHSTAKTYRRVIEYVQARVPNETKTVFWARPTVSTILMTQMIGRALRGEAAGGTTAAYIVSFVDNWNEHIAWVNPDSLFGGNNEFTDNPIEHIKHELRMIAISKIEEFASVLDDSVDTASLEKVPFVQRIPIGMYVFAYLEENGIDYSYQVMVYDSTRKAYEDMMLALPGLFERFGCIDENPASELLEEMAAHCRDTFFLREMIPPYEEKDIIRI